MEETVCGASPQRALNGQKRLADATESLQETVQQFVSVSQKARQLGCSEATIRRRIKDGSLECDQPGGFKKKIFLPLGAHFARQ